ncbi:MAG TPA: ABC transporter substrate-binding protein, partial [Candidatus Binatia bacterium]
MGAIGLILLSLFLSLAVFVADGRAEKIRTAIPQGTLNYLSVYVADAKGFFREEGLDNETIIISGPRATAALLSGDV